MTEEEFRAVLKVYNPDAELEVKSEVIWTVTALIPQEGKRPMGLWTSSSNKELALEDLSWQLFGPVEDSDADADTRK
jgi:hypothetical protein